MNANVKAKIDDIAKNPRQHEHTFIGLKQCCMVDGVLDLRVMAAHGEHVNLGSNGGQRCDVVRGPCACGAWH